MVVENSWRAKAAARFMKSQSVAIVFGSRICISGISKAEFLQHHGWVRHELKHVEQYQRYGFWGFIFRYLWQWLRHGYHANKYEVEARAAEK
ncbi:MAG: DUF4157 domain-containing protein [Bacteroidetes bacterium]|nr:MAG: DUF4157 domain-containing protein [Bacteroidota bacterium]